MKQTRQHPVIQLFRFMIFPFFCLSFYICDNTVIAKTIPHISRKFAPFALNVRCCSCRHRGFRRCCCRPNILPNYRRSRRNFHDRYYSCCPDRY